MKVEKIEIVKEGVRVTMIFDHTEIRNTTGLDYDYFLNNVFQRILENQAIARMVEEKAAEQKLRK